MIGATVPADSDIDVTDPLELQVFDLLVWREYGVRAVPGRVTVIRNVGVAFNDSERSVSARPVPGLHPSRTMRFRIMAAVLAWLMWLRSLRASPAFL